MNDPFTWHSAAVVAGGVCMALLTIIGILLTIILKRQGTTRSEIVSDVQQITERLDKKIDTETTERRESVAKVHGRVESVEKEGRDNVDRIFRKIDDSLRAISSDFKEFCKSRQESCSAIMQKDIENNSALLERNCKKNCERLESIEKDRREKWHEQQVFNRDFEKWRAGHNGQQS